MSSLGRQCVEIGLVFYHGVLKQCVDVGTFPVHECPGNFLRSYLKTSKLRWASISKSVNRTALFRTIRMISAVGQFPVCNKITLGGAPRAMLRFAKSLSLVRNANPCAFAYSQITESLVPLNSTE